MSGSENNQTFKESLTAYLQGVKTEWGKITWPDKRQVVVETVQVMVIVTVFTILLLLADILFKWMLSPLALH